jgi:hypothetical protein
MLEDIRDDLRSVDPLEDEIDRRNADYSRASTEIIRAYIEPDSTVAGKLGILIKALYSGNGELRERLAHGLYRISFLSPSSLSLRRPRDEGDFTAPVSRADTAALSTVEAEFFERMRRRLSLKTIKTWLDEQGGLEWKALFPVDLIKDEDSFIRFVYALLYGDSRSSFDYAVEEDTPEDRSTAAAGYVIPDIRFRRKKEKRESGY